MRYMYLIGYNCFTIAYATYRDKYHDIAPDLYYRLIKYSYINRRKICLYRIRPNHLNISYIYICYIFHIIQIFSNSKLIPQYCLSMLEKNIYQKYDVTSVNIIIAKI